MRQLILPKPVSLLLVLSSMGSLHSQTYVREYPITVVDENNSPLIGVDVYTSDHRFVSITDFKGQVKLKDINYWDEINFSYISYKSVKIVFQRLRQSGGKVKMQPDPLQLQTVQVVGRRDDLETEIPYMVQRIGKEAIASTNSQTTADALRDHAGVFVQKSQMGGGSPLIRGFEANRVLLVLDGVRLNNAIYRNGHLQNAITVDNALLEQVEVIFGPGSLTYGSDALGGVVHFRSKDPKLLFGDYRRGNPYRLDINAYTRFSSANREKSAHFDINFGLRKWAFLTSATYSDYDDLWAGDKRPEAYPEFGKSLYYVERIEGKDQILLNEQPNRQKNTAYSQYGIMQKIRFQPNDELFFIANLQFSNSSSIPRYDRLTETNGKPDSPKFAEWYYGPQFRTLASLKTRWLRSNSLFDKATFIGAFQLIGEDRHERKTNKDWRESSLVDVQVYSLTADFDKMLDRNEQQQLSYGLAVNHNNVSSQAQRLNISTDTILFDVNTRYPSGGSQMSSIGSYVNFRGRNSDSRVVYNAGIRYSLSRLFARFSETDPIEWPQFYIDGISNTKGALTWAAGIRVNTPGKWQIRLLTATSFRTPNIDDFAKIREKNGFVTVPNPGLRPEKALTMEASIAKSFGKLIHSSGKIGGSGLKLSATAFYTRLKNAIVRANFQLPDSSTFFFNGTERLSVQANVNADKASIYGFSGNLLLVFRNRLQLKSGINFTKGSRSFQESDETGAIKRDTLVPQDHIPPMYGQTSIAYRLAKVSLEAVIRYNGAKTTEEYAVNAISTDPVCGILIDREGTSDNIDLGVITEVSSACESPYRGVYGWTTFNFYASYHLSKNLSIDLAIENITDVHYRAFSSGISAPGRNFIVAVRGKF